jgi:hypothetical protein
LPVARRLKDGHGASAPALRKIKTRPGRPHAPPS